MRPPEKPCEYTTLNRALSRLTPDSVYARYRPSRILALGAVTGGPPGVPHGVGGGGRTAFTNHPAASAAAMRTSRPAGVLPVPDSQSIAQAAQMSRRTYADARVHCGHAGCALLAPLAIGSRSIRGHYWRMEAGALARS
jgi:hypothetical protein